MACPPDKPGGEYRVQAPRTLVIQAWIRRWWGLSEAIQKADLGAMPVSITTSCGSRFPLSRETAGRR
jgi:hypothetical protein